MTRDFDPVFSTAIRGELTAAVRSAPRASWLRRHLPLTIGGVLGLALLGAAGTAAANEWLVPGSQQVTALGSTTAISGSGTTTVDLGTAPARVTNIALQFTCDSAATYRFDDGSEFTCAAADIGRETGQVGVDLPVASGTTSTTITTTPSARWSLRAQYTTEHTLPLGVNGSGLTYGADNPGGHPDLLAVTATNGREGYAYQADLTWAENGDRPAPTSPAQAVQNTKDNTGKRFRVPVYLSDGKTRIGTFVVGQ